MLSYLMYKAIQDQADENSESSYNNFDAVTESHKVLKILKSFI